MAKTNVASTHLIIAHWGLTGSATAGTEGYRSQNPWQALEHYMEGKRADARKVFDTNGATARRIDSGGSVWKVELSSIPTAEDLNFEQFTAMLLDKLVEQNVQPDPDDYICVSYADRGGIGRWEWTP